MANIGKPEETIIVVPQTSPVEIPTEPSPFVEPAVTPEPVKEPVPA